jgi:hypothetical protein
VAAVADQRNLNAKDSGKLNLFKRLKNITGADEKSPVEF